MRKLSLSPIAPEISDLDMNYPARNHDFQLAKEKFFKMEHSIKRLLQFKTLDIIKLKRSAFSSTRTSVEE